MTAQSSCVKLTFLVQLESLASRPGTIFLFGTQPVSWDCFRNLKFCWTYLREWWWVRSCALFKKRKIFGRYLFRFDSLQCHTIHDLFPAANNHADHSADAFWASGHFEHFEHEGDLTVDHAKVRGAFWAWRGGPTPRVPQCHKSMLNARKNDRNDHLHAYRPYTCGHFPGFRFWACAPWGALFGKERTGRGSRPQKRLAFFLALKILGGFLSMPRMHWMCLQMQVGEKREAGSKFRMLT